MATTSTFSSFLPTTQDEAEAECLAGLADALTGMDADADRSASYHRGHEAGTSQRASRERFARELGR